MHDESPARVLVVDDSHTTRLHAQNVLESAGYEVEVAADMWIAPTVSAFRPHLILMDVELGLQSGHVAVRALKRRAIGRDIRMALYSTRDPETLARLAAECGADGCIPKDGRAETLTRHVRELLAGELAGTGPPERQG